jgi:hypothetical protein
MEDFAATLSMQQGAAYLPTNSLTVSQKRWQRKRSTPLVSNKKIVS